MGVTTRQKSSYRWDRSGWILFYSTTIQRMGYQITMYEKGNSLAFEPMEWLILTHNTVWSSITALQRVQPIQLAEEMGLCVSDDLSVHEKHCPNERQWWSLSVSTTDYPTSLPPETHQSKSSALLTQLAQTRRTEHRKYKRKKGVEVVVQSQKNKVGSSILAQHTAQSSSERWSSTAVGEKRFGCAVGKINTPGLNLTLPTLNQ